MGRLSESCQSKCAASVGTEWDKDATNIGELNYIWMYASKTGTISDKRCSGHEGQILHTNLAEVVDQAIRKLGVHWSDWSLQLLGPIKLQRYWSSFSYNPSCLMRNKFFLRSKKGVVTYKVRSDTLIWSDDHWRDWLLHLPRSDITSRWFEQIGSWGDQKRLIATTIVADQT